LLSQIALESLEHFLTERRRPPTLSGHLRAAQIHTQWIDLQIWCAKTVDRMYPNVYSSYGLGIFAVISDPGYPIRLLPGDSSPLVVINKAVSRGGEEIHSRGVMGTGPRGPIPLEKKSKQKKIQEPTGEFESINRLSSDSGRDIDEVKGAGCLYVIKKP